jgi:hypothetical protein
MEIKEEQIMKKLGILVVVTGALSMLTACNLFTVTSGSSEEDGFTIEKDKANELEVELNLGAGKMEVSEGTEEWVEGVVQISDNKLKPDVSYKLKKDIGHITIDQPSTKFGNFTKGSLKNEWDVKLSREVPINLNVNAGASETVLNLQGLNLSNLQVDAGVGDITIDLSGDWEESFDVNLSLGVGSAKILLPEKVGVKVVASKGIGDTNFKGLISEGDGVYVNEAYENSDVIITINTDLGIGSATFETK